MNQVVFAYVNDVESNIRDHALNGLIDLFFIFMVIGN